MKPQKTPLLVLIFLVFATAMSGCATSNNENFSRESIALHTPVNGDIVKNYDGNTSRGVTFSAKAGSFIRASAAGRVVYSGHGLNGYGNLVILKHGESFLTVYAFGSTTLVKEGDFVKIDQPISQLGISETGYVEFYFELRRRGKHLNPVSYFRSDNL